MGQYDQISKVPGGEVAKIATELADLNTSISKFVINGDHPNDLMDRRDLLLDQLSQYGQVSVEQLDGGSTNVSFVDGTTGTAYPIVSDKTAAWAGPPAGGWSPGGQMGGLLEVGRSPGGMVDGYLAYDRLVHQLARHRGQRRVRRHLLHHRRPRRRHHRRLGPDPGRAGFHHLGLRRRRLQRPRPGRLAAARATPSIDGAYKAFVAKVGGDLNEATRLQANAQVLTDSVENRRQSVAGVSMDEEMSNLVRFQRAYQASARAMSTMDEMLDVLINRTGRVGL